MGMATAGLIYHAKDDDISDKEIISFVSGQEPSFIGVTYPIISPKFDPRNHDDFIFAKLDNCKFIFNGPIVDDILFNRKYDLVHRLQERLGRPCELMAFCWYDSGGTHGFASFEKGRLVRQLVCGVDGPLTNLGNPLSEEGCGSGEMESILDKVISAKSGWSPLSDDPDLEYRYYRSQASAPRPARHWWKFGKTRQ